MEINKLYIDIMPSHPHLGPLPSRARKKREGIATNSQIYNELYK